MGQKTFFVNIFPTNDRRIDLDYRKLLEKIIQDSKSMGIQHTLFTVGDKRLDPWSLAQSALSFDNKINPIVALNPLYAHPVEVAKRIVGITLLSGGTLALNIVTGSFFNEMSAVGDHLTFEQRGVRMKEFYLILSQLLEGKVVTADMNYYKLRNAEIFPKFSGSKPRYFVSGGMASEFQQETNAFFVKNIKPLDQMKSAEVKNSGLALGVCAREKNEEAIKAVRLLYPDDRRGEMLFEMSLPNKESPWNEWLHENLPKHQDDYNYFLNPMRSYWSAAPFVVGSYEEVAKRIKAYERLGYSFFILDYLPDEAEHVAKVLEAFHAL